ncbi:MAG: hypothetical protein INR71_08925 [Terriglobus roseus]|nr:hypothetical protein [Terriglobus roseus]
MKRLQQERNAAAAGKKGSKTFDPANQRTDNSTKASLTETFDTDLYERNGADKYAGYSTSIAVNDDEDMEDAEADSGRRLVGQYTATRAQMDEFATGGAEEEDILMSREKQAQIASRETDYQKRRHDRGPLTPTRADPFAANSQAGVQEGQSYRDVMEMRELEREEQRVQRLIADQGGENGGPVQEHKASLKDTSDKENQDAGSTVAVVTAKKRKQRWDVATDTPAAADEQATEAKKKSRWDQAPSVGAEEPSKKRSRWDQTPALGGTSAPAATNGAAVPALPV